MSFEALCPITGAAGVLRRVRSGRDIVASYLAYHGQVVPAELAAKYFTQTIEERQCAASGLRWYTPARLGESDFYEWLAAAFPWYYSSEPTWDKQVALDLLQQIGTDGFVEVGSGGGTFLRMAQARGVRGIGIEINEEAIRSCQQEGLEVYHADEQPAADLPLDTMVSIQSLEHVLDPAGYLEALLVRFPVKHLVIAVPSYESLLGWTLDPLAWPPHHYTAWSQQALRCLGQRLSFRLEAIRRDVLQYSEYLHAVALESTLSGSRLLPLARFGPVGKATFKVLCRLGIPWAAHRHSIVATLVREDR